MARVKKAEILNRDNWEYFSNRNEDGSAEWVKGDISRRGVVHHFPDGWGFYSWLPSVVWNEKLGLFIMATGGTQRPGTGEVSSSWPHSKSGSLMFLWAEKPWGPWHQFFWKENWQAGEEINRLYLPQLSPKWISDGGTVMHLIFSDAANGHSTYYKWNMQRVRIKMSSHLSGQGHEPTPTCRRFRRGPRPHTACRHDTQECPGSSRGCHLLRR
jgi:hypothetical protein